MFRVYETLTQRHDLQIVAAAALLCALAALTAINLHSRAAASAGARRLRWLAAAAFVTGSGIWATHFVAMLAFQTHVGMGFDPVPTAASIVIAIVVTGAGLAIATYRPHLAFGAGLVVGAGIGAMHFVGMLGMTTPAHVEYGLVYVGAALAIGMAFAAGALRLATGARSEGRRAVAALFLAFAILGLHFTAMAAAHVDNQQHAALGHGAVHANLLAMAIGAVTLLIVALGLAGSLMDRLLAARSMREAERLRAHVVELEEAKAQLVAAAAALSAARDAAEAGSRSKSQFLAAMSHELRTPLNAVIGFAEMLGKEPFGPLGHARYREYVEHIGASGTHLLNLINDVLEFSRSEAGALQLQEGEVSIGGEIAAALETMMPKAVEAGVILHHDAAHRLPPVRADARRIRQILLNLLSNAIKFTPAAGTVRIGAALDGGALRIRVSDTGIGIAPADLPKVFESFSQIDSRLARRYEGSGLGLPLTRQLVERHGGTLAIESKPGAGTTVTVTLPASRVMAAKPDRMAA